VNYYAARQRLSDGRWNYTMTNDGRTQAVGYCCAYRPFGADDLLAIFCGDAGRMAQENEEHGRHAGKYHSDGHASSEEACDCYRKYLLDHQSRLHALCKDDAEELHRCAICNDWCANMGKVGHLSHWFLCDAHLTQQSLEELFPSVGESWSSY
jgi:hypothetical protein